MNIKEVIKMYNNDNMSLKEIGVQFCKSKSTVQRLIAKEGYVLDKNTGKYINLVSNDEETELLENSEVVAFALADGTNNFEEHKEKFVTRTYSIPEQFDRALKVKSAIEGITVSDILRDILQKNIEQKYFDLVKDV